MVVKHLPQDHFDNVVRWIKQTDADRLSQISTMLGKAMERLGRRRRLRMGAKGIPSGSDHFDTGSFLEWLNKVERDDEEAVTQVVILDATVQNRLVG